MRKQILLWLNLDKPDEYEIAEAIDGLKEKRSFSKTVRDGIRLIVDLRAGNTDVLHELFPWVHAQAGGAGGSEGGGSEHHSDEQVQRLLDQFEGYMMRPSAVPILNKPPLASSVDNPPKIQIAITQDKPDKDKTRQTYENFMRTAIQLQASVGTELIIPGINDGNARQLANTFIPKDEPIALDDIAL